MSLLPVGIGPQEGGYQIERSLRFNSADSAYLSKVFTTPTNNKKWTISMWVKRSALAANQTLFSQGYDGSDYFDFRFNTSDQLYVQNRVGASNLLVANTTAVFRDVSAWYHLVFVFDSDNATAAYRNRLWMNNVEYTWSANSGSGNASSFNRSSAQPHVLGISQTNGSPGLWAGLNGYLTEINFIDGSALDPTSFGEYNTDTGVWQPKAYTGSYGTNGFYLDFADNSSTTALGYDAAGSNDWTPNNFSVTAGAGNDSLVDTPTPYGTDTGAGGEVRGNYATLNPLDNGGLTLTNGNLNSTKSGTSWLLCRATQGVSSGKWYFEGTFTQGGTTDATQIGICRSTSSLSNYLGAGADAYSYGDGANKYNNGSGVSYGATYTTNDVIGVAFDLDAGTITFYKNGTSQGQAYSGLSGTFFPAVDNYNGSAWVLNFGQRPFAYTAPSGFKALCTQNLPEPTVKDGGDYFNALTYNGSATSQNITGVGFSPDLVWIKTRSGAESHQLVDQVRGATKALMSNETSAETTWTNGLSAFLSDGFTLPGGNNRYSDTGYTYVAWNWKANGAGVTNTAGTITSTVSANTTAGFSIVTYTGSGTGSDTIGHGLGVAPSWVITKNRSNTDNWIVYFSISGTKYYAQLNLTNAATSTTGYTSPTSTVFNPFISLGSGDNYVAYCFAPIAGYSAFGSYTGNGSADGPFVYTGFRPRWVMIKRADAGDTTNWFVFDTERATYNLVLPELYANLSNAEGTDGKLDILSNGFKIRTSGSGSNSSSINYIYAAFAENPFKYSLAR